MQTAAQYTIRQKFHHCIGCVFVRQRQSVIFPHNSCFQLGTSLTNQILCTKGFSLFSVRQPPVGQGHLIHEVSRSHTTKHQSVGLLWKSDQVVAETSTWQHTTLTTDIHAPDGIRTHNFSKRAVLDSTTTGTGTLGLQCVNIGAPLLRYCKEEVSFSIYFLYCRNFAWRWPKLSAEICRLCEK